MNTEKFKQNDIVYIKSAKAAEEECCYDEVEEDYYSTGPWTVKSVDEDGDVSLYTLGSGWHWNKVMITKTPTFDTARQEYEDSLEEEFWDHPSSYWR